MILEPLHNLLRKNFEFEWSKKCHENFEKMKKYLCSKTILAIFDPHSPIYVYTDAFLQGVGAVLKQSLTDGVGKPVFYFS